MVAQYWKLNAKLKDEYNFYSSIQIILVTPQSSVTTESGQSLFVLKYLFDMITRKNLACSPGIISKLLVLICILIEDFLNFKNHFLKHILITFTPPTLP